MIPAHQTIAEARSNLELLRQALSKQVGKELTMEEADVEADSPKYGNSWAHSEFLQQAIELYSLEMDEQEAQAAQRKAA
jgi:hypothetical protein